MSEYLEKRVEQLEYVVAKLTDELMKAKALSKDAGHSVVNLSPAVKSNVSGTRW